MYLLILDEIEETYDYSSALHSTMYLLIWYRKRTVHCTVYSLHSTMYLLISVVPSSFTKRPLVFTFHYVSINISGIARNKITGEPLHSTMYLLISIDNLLHFLSSSSFTFHYVSINMDGQLNTYFFLHTLYIPLCIY